MRSELSLGKLNLPRFGRHGCYGKANGGRRIGRERTHAFMALQARAHANSMFQIAQDPKYTALISSYRDAKAAKMAIVSQREAALQKAGAKKNEVYASFEKKIEDRSR